MRFLRFAALAPAIVALPSLLPRSVATQLVGHAALMDGGTAFGLVFLSITWFIYFSQYKYGRRILLAQGLLSLPLTLLIVAGYIWNFSLPFMHLLVPVNSPFMLNLAIVFSACYLIQVLYYWLPRTTIFVNMLLAVIFFITTLSVSGHVYRLNEIVTARLLMPIQPAAIVAFLLLSATIFMHANHKQQLYLNKKIMASFLLMFVAIVIANVVVYKNFTRTVELADKVNTTRQTLTSVYDADLQLSNAATAAQAYGPNDNTQPPTDYRKDKQAYLATMRQVQSRISPADSTYQSIQSMAALGRQILATADTMIAQTQSHTGSALTRSGNNKLLDNYSDQLFEGTKAVTADYTRQLNDMFQQEAYGGQGIVTGVSITSALSVLLIIFTPLFIRQTIEKLSLTQNRLRLSYQQLFEEESRVEAILTNMGEGIFAVDADGIVTTFNHAAEQLTGLAAEAVVNKPYADMLRFTATTGASETAANFVSKALAGKTSELSHNVTLWQKSGHTLDVQISASPVRSHRGVVGAIVVFRDRTSEQALENAKDDFVSLASHQLRTPATATKQFLAMFLEGYAGKIDDRQRLFLQQAYDNNELGIEIIEDLLNATRLESNRLKVDKEKIELGEFLKRTAEQHQAYADRGEQIIQVLVPRKHVYIESDVSLLGMAVDNLVTNALKYSTEKSTVTVQLTVADRLITIAVSDSGIGIKKADIPKIFGRFSRLEDPQKQHVSGTGIGLYLVKRIAQVLHAKIKVTSEYGKGSTFTMEFKAVE